MTEAQSGTVLVTGGGGFIGSAVVRSLVGSLGGEARFADGSPVERVVALLRPGGTTERLEELRPGATWAVEYADLDDRAQLQTTLRRFAPRAILHLATPAPHPPAATRTLETLVAALAGVPGGRFVHTGSAWVLAPGTGLDERAPVEPRSDYARAKLLEDEALPALAGQAGVEWINLRLFNVFGRYEQSSRLIPHLVEQLSTGAEARLSQGDQVRDFTDVDVVAGAFLLALSAPASACGSLYHIGSGRGTSARAVATKVAALVADGASLRFGEARTRDDELPCLVADPRRARDELGWDPPSDLDAALEAVVRWWLERLAREPVLAHDGRETREVVQ